MAFQPGKKNPEWSDFTKLLSDISFVKKCLSFDPSKLSSQKAASVHKYLELNELDKWGHNGKVKRNSKAMSSLHRWVLGLLQKVSENSPIIEILQ
jgi:hypothetical protein